MALTLDDKYTELERHSIFIPKDSTFKFTGDLRGDCVIYLGLIVRYINPNDPELVDFKKKNGTI